MNISFIGLGKLGLPLACCLAESGHKIIGVDSNQQVIRELQNKRLPFYETGLQSLFDMSYDNFDCFTHDYEYAIQNSSATIILVNTQLGDKGYSTHVVDSVISQLCDVLKKKTEYHLIILSSTVPPESCNSIVETIMRKTCKEHGKDFGFTYVPDFVKLGSVIKDFKNPEFFMVGGNLKKAIDMTKDIFSPLHYNDCPEYSCSLLEAEIAKVALNAFIVLKISFANFLGILCDTYHTVNVHKITEIIGNDKRISPHFFKSGAPYGGTCFPRDTAAFIDFANRKSYDAKHISFCEEVNDLIIERIIQKIENRKCKNIGILGVSFKPDSPVTIGSPSVRLINELVEKYNVNVFDCLEETYKNLNNDKVNTWLNAQDCINNSDCVIIMHMDKYFSELDYSKTMIIDMWGITQI